MNIFPAAERHSPAPVCPVKSRHHLVHVAHTVVVVIVGPLLLAPVHGLHVSSLESHAVLDHPRSQHSSCYFSLKFKETLNLNLNSNWNHTT